MHLLAWLVISAHFRAKPVVASPCTCTSDVVSVQVNVLVPNDASDPFAGFNSSSGTKRTINKTYGINSILCEPDVDKFPGVVQLLVHGFTYNRQYWTMPVSSFENYSFVDFACERGLSSFAYDSLASGLSERPTNASEVQLPVVAQVASRLAAGLKSKSSMGVISFKSGRPFNQVIGVGHSLGSITLNVAAILDGASSPFDAFVLTSGRHIPLPNGTITSPARDIDPSRWVNLDPDYVSTIPGIRAVFYSSNTTSYSQRILALDEMTKDIGSVFAIGQFPSSFFRASGYSGPLFYVLGDKDTSFCADSSCDGKSNQSLIIANEKIYWPNSENISVFVAVGLGHDLNFHFGAEEVFGTMVQFVKSISGL